MLLPSVLPPLGSWPGHLSRAWGTSLPSKDSNTSQIHCSLLCPPLCGVRRSRKIRRWGFKYSPFFTLISQGVFSRPTQLYRTELGQKLITKLPVNFRTYIQAKVYTWAYRISGTEGVLLYNSNLPFVTTLYWIHSNSIYATRSYQNISMSLQTASNSLCKYKR